MVETMVTAFGEQFASPNGIGLAEFRKFYDY